MVPELRKIIHIDMDAFYASIEQRDHPELNNKPVAVGGDRSRGVVAAASYEARKFGVRSAMPSVTARRLCPGLVFIKPRFEVYKTVSKQIMEIFREYTNLVEPLSLDEAFLDVTINKKDIKSATTIAISIKEKIKLKTGLTASAGISINKFLAKIASDYQKPDGLYVIKPESAEKFVEQLQVEKFFGVGKVTAMKMHKMGIHTGNDLKKLSRSELITHFGKAGSYYFDISRGIDNRAVNPNRERKSVGTEHTFEKDLIRQDEINKALDRIRSELTERIIRSNFRGRTLTLKVKFGNFEQITRSKTISGFLTGTAQIDQLSGELMRSVNISNRGIRLLGLTVSNQTLPNEDPQLKLDFNG